MARVMQRVAEREGWEVRPLSDSAAAIDVFLEFVPDVVVLDMVMPGKDGLDVLNEMLLCGVPARVVVVSGFGTAYLRLAEGVAVFHGVDRVSTLKKPFRQAEFIAALDAEPSQPLPAA
jgi:DNA-binding response OmpR family regulator